MSDMNAAKVARARVLPRWNAAFRQKRYYYEQGNGRPVPFTIEQCTAICSGATVVDLGTNITATIQSDQVLVDGDLFELKTGYVQPEDLVVSVNHDSLHMDLGVILKELDIVTGIAACRWMIEVEKSGRITVDIAPSESYIAAEIRLCSATDMLSTAQWLLKYDVKATRAQLVEVFGPGALTLGPDAGNGRDASVIADFYAPLLITLHSRGTRNTRTINARGVDSIAKVLSLAPAGCWYLHGVPLLRFDDVAIWRCCVHSNKCLPLYNEPHQGEFQTRETLAGVVQLPVKASCKAFPSYVFLA